MGYAYLIGGGVVFAVICLVISEWERRKRHLHR